MPSDLHYTPDEVRDLDLLDLSSHRMRLDLLALHDEVAALREQADRMRAVLRALADGYEHADHLGDVASSLLHGLGLRGSDVEGDGFDFQRNLAHAIRTLAGEASR